MTKIVRNFVFGFLELIYNLMLEVWSFRFLCQKSYYPSRSCFAADYVPTPVSSFMRVLTEMILSTREAFVPTV